MIAIVYASLLICAVAAPAITSLGWLALGGLALLIFVYLMIAEWMQRRRRSGGGWATWTQEV